MALLLDIRLTFDVQLGTACTLVNAQHIRGRAIGRFAVAIDHCSNEAPGAEAEDGADNRLLLHRELSNHILSLQTRVALPHREARYFERKRGRLVVGPKLAMR